MPGGGAVFYVSSETHSYLQHVEHREEAGTPDTVGCVRAGLVYHVHSLLAQPQLEAVEDRLALRLLRTLHAQPKIHLL
ncbi:MAG: aminotransferase, partial [Promethearchaeia archaeon]